VGKLLVQDARLEINKMVNARLEFNKMVTTHLVGCKAVYSRLVGCNTHPARFVYLLSSLVFRRYYCVFQFDIWSA